MKRDVASPPPNIDVLVAMDSVPEICAKIRELLDTAVRKNLAACILLSGGLDTSLVAATASKYAKLTGVTVTLGNAPDTEFAKLIANRFQMTHLLVQIDENDAERSINDVVKVMKTFDPMEVRNDASIMIGLKAAKDAGFDKVLTGDAADELFAGYSFLFKKDCEEIERNLRNLWRVMRFSSIPLAQSIGMEAELPFLENEFKNLAMTIPVELKVREERGRVYGKWILRKAYEGILPDEILWRVKMPIEQGSGTSILPSYFEANISDDAFKGKRISYEASDHVRLSSKEQLAYYESYRAAFGSANGSGEGNKVCHACGARVAEKVNFCRTCGAYPI